MGAVDWGISGATGLYAVIGDPVRQSLLPRLMNDAFRHHGIDRAYIALPVALNNLAQSIKAIRGFGFKGINVTMPLKEAIIECVDDLTDEARMVGAVNCIAERREGLWLGTNTESVGAGLAWQSILQPHRVFIFGAGGMGRAVAVELGRRGTGEVFIANRNYERAAALCERSNAIGKTHFEPLAWEPSVWADILAESDLIINATSLGIAGHGDLASQIPWVAVKPSAVVFDTVYEPLQTSLLTQARARRMEVIEGSELLLWQAVASFAFWTSKPAPVDIMRRTLRESLSSHY